MANVPIESGIGGLWMVKQPTAGTIAPIATAGSIRPRFVGGGLKAGKVIGSESYVDGERFANPSMHVESVAGEVGDVTVQGVAEEVGCLWAYVLGVDTVTGASDPYTHTITSAATTGAILTVWQRTGSAVGPVRQAFYDAKVASLEWECSRDQLVSHATAKLMSLVAAEVYSTDPSTSAIAEDPLLWTEASGAVTINATAYRTINGDSVSVDTKMEAYWGDSVTPACLVEGKGELTRSMSMILTDDTLALFNNAIYGTASPAALTKPTSSVYYAAMVATYTRSASRSVAITTPNVAIDPADIMVAPQPDGGTVELTLGGTCLKSGVTPALSVVVKCARSTAMV